MTKSSQAKGAARTEAGGVVSQEHWSWEGRDVGCEALGQQKEVKAEPRQHEPDQGLISGTPSS